MSRKIAQPEAKSTTDKRRVAGLTSPRASAAAAIAFMMFAPTAYGTQLSSPSHGAAVSTSDLEAQFSVDASAVLPGDNVTRVSTLDLETQQGVDAAAVLQQSATPFSLLDLETQQEVDASAVMPAQDEASACAQATSQCRKLGRPAVTVAANLPSAASSESRRNARAAVLPPEAGYDIASRGRSKRDRS